MARWPTTSDAEDDPPTLPEHWAARDAALATDVRLAAPVAPSRGLLPCACGGTWRSVLLPHATHPLWRCLHCGTLHRGTSRIAEAGSRL